MPNTIGLWGELPLAESAKAPKQILNEQADAFSQAMEYKLCGKVASERDTNAITVDLSILAPELNHFEVGILRVRHGVLMYPLRLENLVRSEAWLTCNNQQEFEAGLTRILQAPETRKIVSSLLAQVKG